MSLYEQMKNPMNEESLESIIHAYTEYGSFYEGLVRARKDEKITRKYIPKDRDAFYQEMYKWWKKSIVYRVQNDFVNDKYKEAFQRLLKYLDQKNPQTSEEIVDTINGYDVEEDKEVKYILDQLRWDRVGEFTGWDHIKSNAILTGLVEQPEVLHRLYLNCDSNIIDKFSREFVRKCLDRKIPFYFKFDDAASRNDCFVIYSDNKYLKEYIKIIKEIREEQHLEDCFHTPTILSSPIDGFIGYGSEPLPPQGNEELESFNTKRERHLSQCIRNTTLAWMKRNQNAVFTYNGKKTTYVSYAIQDLIKMKREKYIKYLRLQDLKEEDFQSIDFDITLRAAIIKNYQSIMESIEKNTPYSLEIPYKGIVLYLYKSDLTEWIRRQTKFINEHSKRYKKDLLEEIKNTSKDFEIDPNNYAVDLSKIEFLSREEKVKNLDPKETIKEENYTVKQEPKRGIVKEKYRPMTDEEIMESRKKLGL